MRRILIILFSSFFSVIVGTAQKPSKEMVKAQLNQALISLNNIINNQSLEVVDFELDQILNNLTIEQLLGIDEIAYWRQNAIEGFGKINISQQEKQILKKILEKKREGLLYDALSNALSPTIMITGGGQTKAQLAFQLLLGASRTGVEYTKSANQLDIESIEENWNLRKQDLETFIELRKELLGTTYNLFGKYGLKEKDRLTEKSATLLSSIYQEPNKALRLRRLKDNYAHFGDILGYNYHLGMAYIDNNQPTLGIKYLKEYIQNYHSTPIYRVNPYLGYASQAILTYDSSLTSSQKITFINNIIKNLPNDGASAISCALILKNQLNRTGEALNILRRMIDNPDASQKNEMASVLLTWKDDWRSNATTRKDIIKAISQSKDVGLDNYLYLISIVNPSKFWDFTNANIALSGNPFGIGLDKFSISISRKLFSTDHLTIYSEQHNKKLKITEYNIIPTYGYTISELAKKSSAIKSNPLLINLLFDYLFDGRYVAKAGLPIDKITSNTYGPLKEFNLTDSEAKELGKLCSKSINSKILYTAKPAKENPQAKIPSFTSLGKAGFKTFSKNVKDAVNANRLYNKDLKISFSGQELAIMAPVFNPVSEKFITLKLNGMFPITITWFLGDDDKFKPYASIINNHLSFAPGLDINSILKEVHEMQTKPTITEKISKTAKSGYNEATNMAKKGVNAIKEKVKREDKDNK